MSNGRARQHCAREGAQIRDSYWHTRKCTFLLLTALPFCFFLLFHTLGGTVTDVNVAIRKIANLLKPDKDITHDGDHIVIKTLSTFKNYNMDFYVGQEFEEDLSGVDDRKCMVGSRRWKVFRWILNSLIGEIDRIFVTISLLRTKSALSPSLPN